MKKRTRIGDISITGFELTDAQLQRVTGGAIPTCTDRGKCLEASGSITDPRNPDTATDCRPD